MRNNIRNMRKSSVLNSLFPHVRGGVLAATLIQPAKWWYLSELADRLGTSPSSLQRELSSLVASGILAHRREGTRAYFKAETKSPVFRELQQLFQKTAGLVNPLLAHVLKDALPVCPRFGATLMDPQTIDLDHGRPLFDPLEKHALRQLNGFQLRIRFESQPLPERFGDDNPPRFIDPEGHANDNTICHHKWQSSGT